MNPIRTFKTFLYNISEIARVSKEMRVGMDNQSQLINRKAEELIVGLKRQTEIMNNKMNQQLEILQHAYQYTLKTGTNNSTIHVNNGFQAPPSNVHSFEDVLRQHDLMFAPKTYNTSHPDYDANVVRNFPGKVFNVNNNPLNPLYRELKKMISNSEIQDDQWTQILDECLAEAKTVPGAEQVFERKKFVENYISDLEQKNNAFYRPGWVNVADGLFLYWVVRKLKPKVIVQTGVCNGLSSAFMMLALAKNGPDGTLHVVDMPPVYDSKDPNWKIPGKVYGVTIPEGKTSGWLVPDMYKDRYEVLSGDAKELLPPLLKKLGKIDMFYHDSDHTYDHMMFEFIESKKYLTEFGVIVSDDISWNASLWDFADKYAAPAYNYKGSMGIACF